MKSKYIDNEFKYDGTQLKSLFAYMNYGIAGDSILSWQGPCAIDFSNMIDGEDCREGSEIRGDKMLHFIVEKFAVNLFSAVCLQRLLASLAIDVLQDLVPSGADAAQWVHELHRDGDDIFLRDRKFSISIATVSPVSALIHFAVNITNEGTPVRTLSLADFEIDPLQFAQALIEKFVEETEAIEFATQKVRPADCF